MQSVGNVEDPTLALDDSEVFPVLIEQSAATGYSPQAKRPPRELPCLPKSARGDAATLRERSDEQSELNALPKTYSAWR